MNRLHHAISLADGRPLPGAALYFYDPVFLEIAALMGFKVIWIEMEQAAITSAEAVDLCHPMLLAAAEQIVCVARKHGKKVVTACGAADFIHWTRLGVDLLFCTNDIVCLKAGVQLALKAAAMPLTRLPLKLAR